MKKCTFCGKEVTDDFEGVCPECGGEVLVEEKLEDDTSKSASKKKLGIIVAAIAIVACVAAAGTFFVLNSDNDAPVSQEESADKNKDAKEEADKPASENADSADNSVDSSDEIASSEETGTESSSSESDAATILPEDFKMEDMESLIDEFNNTTDEKRKEELRLILEAIFSQAEELTVE